MEAYPQAREQMFPFPGETLKTVNMRHTHTPDAAHTLVEQLHWWGGGRSASLGLEKAKENDVDLKELWEENFPFNDKKEQLFIEKLFHANMKTNLRVTSALLQGIAIDFTRTGGGEQLFENHIE